MSKKNRSARKLASCRANGALSKGPITQEGKARSSQNALKHGLTAAAVVLSTESPEEFEKFFDSYIRRHQPADEVELECVRTIAVCAWRRQRAWTIERGAYELEMDRQRESLNKEFEKVSDQIRTTLAFKATQSPDIRRYEIGLDRQIARAERQLQSLQQNRPQDKGPQNDPNPDIEQVVDEGPSDIRVNSCPFVAKPVPEVGPETAIPTEGGANAERPSSHHR